MQDWWFGHGYQMQSKGNSFFPLEKFIYLSSFFLFWITLFRRIANLRVLLCVIYRLFLDLLPTWKSSLSGIMMDLALVKHPVKTVKWSSSMWSFFSLHSSLFGLLSLQNCNCFLHHNKQPTSNFQGSIQARQQHIGILN